MLYYCVMYLSPSDYHGYHSPVDWNIESRVHYPGQLFPVNSWATNYIRGVFGLNERVVLNGKWKHGFFSYIPVGAYNVGSMDLNFEKEFSTNLKKNVVGEKDVKEYNVPISVKKGENIGFFNMGSTVVLVFEAPPLLFMKLPGQKIKLGETLTIDFTPEMFEEHKERLENRKKISTRLNKRKEETIEESIDAPMEDILRLREKDREAITVRKTRSDDEIDLLDFEEEGE
eukprot:TRINITY_DN7353_c0_g1_i2.p1 TRINITY_DN7353_c0_g1~~TRINITY_DN7353_c0_g1_i2.p1  ORF type:complete len:229 (-),score=59.77 TRINITY_DN7353_c0_g1_i2:90-776(-)